MGYIAPISHEERMQNEATEQPVVAEEVAPAEEAEVTEAPKKKSTKKSAE